MKKKDMLSFGLILVTFIFCIAIYNKLPDSIPIHWNVNGDIDNYGSRPFIFLGPILSLLSFLGLKFLPKIDPRSKNYIKYEKQYDVIVFFLVLFLCLLSFVTIFASLGYNIPVDKIIPLIVGILFIILGNYLPKCKSTFFFGIRTPWTLSNDDVWRKTHRLSGKLYVISGLIIVIAPFIFSGNVLLGFIIFAILLCSLVPCVMSYIFFYKSKN